MNKSFKVNLTISAIILSLLSGCSKPSDEIPETIENTASNVVSEVSEGNGVTSSVMVTQSKSPVDVSEFWYLDTYGCDVRKDEGYFVLNRPSEITKYAVIPGYEFSEILGTSIQQYDIRCIPTIENDPEKTAELIEDAYKYYVIDNAESIYCEWFETLLEELSQKYPDTYYYDSSEFFEELYKQCEDKLSDTELYKCKLISENKYKDYEVGVVTSICLYDKKGNPIENVSSVDDFCNYFNNLVEEQNKAIDNAETINGNYNLSELKEDTYYKVGTKEEGIAITNDIGAPFKVVEYTWSSLSEKWDIHVVEVVTTAFPGTASVYTPSSFTDYIRICYSDYEFDIGRIIPTYCIKISELSEKPITRANVSANYIYNDTDETVTITYIKDGTSNTVDLSSGTVWNINYEVYDELYV